MNDDDKQIVRDLFKKPYSKQALDAALDAFNDLSGKDRRALAAEFLSSPLGKNFESLRRRLAHAAEKLAPQLQAVTEFDRKKAIRAIMDKAVGEKNKLGGDVRGDQKSKSADKWRIPAAALAKEIWLSFPELSVASVGKRIQKLLPDNQPPSDRALAELIKPLKPPQR